MSIKKFWFSSAVWKVYLYTCIVPVCKKHNQIRNCLLKWQSKQLWFRYVDWIKNYNSQKKIVLKVDPKLLNTYKTCNVFLSLNLPYLCHYFTSLPQSVRLLLFHKDNLRILNCLHVQTCYVQSTTLWYSYFSIIYQSVITCSRTV